MNCRRTQRHLLSYSDKTLSEKKMNEIEMHLQKCSDCSEFYAFTEKTMRSVSGFSGSNVETSMYFTSAVLEKIKNSSSETASPWTWVYQVLFSRISVVTASFAGLIVGVFLGVMLSSVQVERNQSAVATSEEETLEDVYVAGMSDNYYTQFFENQTNPSDGNK